MLLVRLVVTAALQREWGFAFNLYLPDHVQTEADHVAVELRLPPPGEDFGHPCLSAAARLLRHNAPASLQL
ncbi:MAG: hypothetical protein DLM70_16670 [Chloroflexi bacterium]|nr:MAG: hypothetical protein DLM70_16670 [Chloroflexota bacterium]